MNESGSEGMRRLETDVLIVGGGLAALRAAIEAQAQGSRVVVASKGAAGRSGSSAITSAGYTAALCQAEPDSPELHYEDTLRDGDDINDKRLVQALCTEAVDRFWELVSWGVAFQQDPETGKYVQHPSGDHSRRRVAVGAERGTGMTLPLKERAAGVTFLDHVMALDLMRDGDGISGMIGLDTRSHDLVVVVARSTVLATGGVGRLYPLTSNPSDVTGDGLAAAYRAGAVLTDLEMVQFYPWRLVSYVSGRMPVQPSSFASGAVLRNALGERFMARYDPERRDSATRAVSARAIYTEIVEGRGIDGGVLVDLSGIPLDTFRALNPRVARFFDEHGPDLAQARLLLAPEAHFYMGGVRIDEWARSSLPYLYAVGEVSGGVHGSNRADSNAIPAGQVFGCRGGMAAAQTAAGRPAPQADEALLARWQERRAALLGGDGQPANVPDIRGEVQDLTWRHAGIIRNGEGLERGRAALAELRARIKGLKPAQAAQLPAFVEVENMALVSELIVAAAGFRTESRGAHYRADFPERDDEGWLANVDVCLDERGEPALSKRAVA